MNMKKSLLMLCTVVASFAATAQVTLGSSPYTQNFNSLSSGVPSGWRVYNSSGANTLGTLSSLNPSATTGIFNDTACGATNVSSGGFKNYASANIMTEGSACAAQQTATDRAMGIRQVSKGNATNPNTDSGAAFVLVLANTTGLTNFNLSFKLQSLDTSSPRTTTWMVDYTTDISATPPTFTPVTTSPAVLTTGGHTFSNTSVTVNFGAALDNKSGNVYIRIVTLEPSTGSGNRASTAIDDVSLSFTGGTSGVNDVTANGTVGFSVVGMATTSGVNFSATTAVAGTYNVDMFDMTGRKVYTTAVNLNAGTQTISAGSNLTPGMYIARLSNGAATATAKVMVN